MFLTKNEAKEYMRKHPEDYLKPDRSSERSGIIKGYVCPICGSGTHDKGTGITTKDGIHFTCWAGCFRHADIIDIIGLAHGLNENDHVQKFEAAALEFGIEVEADEVYHPVSQEAEVKKNSQNSLAEEDYRNFFLEAQKNLSNTTYHRGISLETLKKYGVGYVSAWRVSEKAPYSPRLIIPTYEQGYLARDTRENLTEEERKYAKLRRGHVMIYNYRALWESQEPIFIVEGELDCLSVIDVGGTAVGLGSTVNVKRLLSELKKQRPSQPLILLLDNDDVGRKATEELANGLRKDEIFFYRSDLPQGYKDANDYLMKNRNEFSKWIGYNKKFAIENLRNNNIDDERKQFDSEVVFNNIEGFLKRMRESREGIAISTGFLNLDKLLDGGLYPGLYVIGALSSLGKTTFVLQMADQIAQLGQGVLIFSLEMSRNELMAKSLSRLMFIEELKRERGVSLAKTTRGILRGKFYDISEEELFNVALDNYSAYGSKINIVEGVGDIGVQEIIGKVMDYIKYREGERPVLIIDYLQILAPYDMRATDKQNTDKAVLELKRLSRDYGLPVIAVSSFNRENYLSPVSMSSFKESGAIEYSSDVLMGLQYLGWDYQEQEKDLDRARRLRDLLKQMEQTTKATEEAGGIDMRKLQLKVLKHRNGRKGEVRLGFVSKYNYFQEE